MNRTLTSFETNSSTATIENGSQQRLATRNIQTSAPRFPGTGRTTNEDFEVVNLFDVFISAAEFLIEFIQRPNLAHYWNELKTYITRLLNLGSASDNNVAETGNPQTSSAMGLEQQLVEFRMESADQEDEKKLAELAEKLAEKRARTERAMLELEADGMKNEEDFERRKLESQQKLEELKEKSKMEQFLKDKTAALELSRLTQLGKHGLENMEKSRLESHALYQEKIHNMDKTFADNHRNINIEEEKRAQELLEHEEKIEKRRRAIEEKLEQDLRNMRENGEFRRQGIEEQVYQVEKMLQMKYLNEVMEKNWTGRLNKLRNSFKEVDMSYKIDKTGDNLLSAVSNQKLVMTAEKMELRRMYEETGKTFLLDIEEVVGGIIEEADRLIYLLENEPSNKKRIEACYLALSRVTLGIPTMAELKQRYRENNDF